MTLCLILLLLIKFMERLIKIKNSDYRMLVVSILFLCNKIFSFFLFLSADILKNIF